MNLRKPKCSGLFHFHSFFHQCKDCLRCDDTHSCYVIDNNGYIILSNHEEDTGRFFGEKEGKAMQKLVDLEIFKMITVYDYQAVCKEPKEDENAQKSFAFALMTVRQNHCFP